MNFSRDGVKNISSARFQRVNMMRTLQARQSQADRDDIRQQIRRNPGFRHDSPTGDIDVIISEYIADPVVGDKWAPPSDGGLDEDDLILRMSELNGVICPLCACGCLAIPIPGILACDSCSEMQLRLRSDEVQLSDITSSLDYVIRAHSCCGPGAFFTISQDRTRLVFSCASCGPVDTLV